MLNRRNFIAGLAAVGVGSTLPLLASEKPIEELVVIRYKSKVRPEHFWCIDDNGNRCIPISPDIGKWSIEEIKRQYIDLCHIYSKAKDKFHPEVRIIEYPSGDILVSLLHSNWNYYPEDKSISTITYGKLEWIYG
jgi:hypothetical protein